MLTRGSRLAFALGCLVALLANGRPASAQTGANVLIVSNALSERSDQIAEYYSRKRAVPSDQILRLAVPIADEIQPSVYATQIAQPIMEWLQKHSAQDRILYIVLTKDIPLRVIGSGGQGGTTASVDSELTLLYRKLVGTPTRDSGRVKNPYFLADGDIADAKPFTHRDYDFYLVARLDGYTVDDVKAMIDRGSAPSRQGVIVLDGRFELSESIGTKWLTNAAANVKKISGWSDRVITDSSLAVLEHQPNVLGYYSWGSNATNSVVRQPHNQWAPGAIGAEFVSTDARTFTEPPANWAINDTSNIFRGSHQSLVGDLIREGITGVAGHVAEPYLDSTIRPDVLFPAYLSGFNLVESFYLAMPALSWQTVVVGDPLCSPFGSRTSRTLSEADINPPLDDISELPAFFSERRVSSLTAQGVKLEAVRWLAKADVRVLNNDTAGARAALERATTIDPALTSAQLALAALDEQEQHWDAAIARYRQVIATVPTHAIALNNLAFALSVRKGDPNQALPFSMRAHAANPDPKITDTLAWTYHLLGQDQAAAPLIRDAIRRRTGDPELLLHAAFIEAGTGNVEAALTLLNQASGLNPAIDQQADVQALRGRISPQQ